MPRSRVHQASVCLGNAFLESKSAPGDGSLIRMQAYPPGAFGIPASSTCSRASTGGALLVPAGRACRPRRGAQMRSVPPGLWGQGRSLNPWDWPRGPPLCPGFSRGDASGCPWSSLLCASKTFLKASPWQQLLRQIHPRGLKKNSSRKWGDCQTPQLSHGGPDSWSLPRLSLPSPTRACRKGGPARQAACSSPASSLPNSTPAPVSAPGVRAGVILERWTPAA